VTRESDRRLIAQLVDIALAVPALEVFADRQPVEFGLTEVVEQCLVEYLSLPSEWEGNGTPPAQWLTPVRSWRSDWRLVVQGRGERREALKPTEHVDALVWTDYGLQPKEVPSPTEINRLFDRVDKAYKANSSDLEHAVRALIAGLKADLLAAMASGDEARVYAAVAHAREVELPERQRALEVISARRLHTVLETGDMLAMRQALSAASALGCGHLEMYARVHAEHQRLYEEQLAQRLTVQLETASRNQDALMLVSVRRVAEQHGLAAVSAQALCAGLDLMLKLQGAGDGAALARAHRAAEDAGWRELAACAEEAAEEVALVEAAAQDSLMEIKAIELRARQRGQVGLAQRAANLAQEVASHVRDGMGLPADWDVVHVMGETDVSRLVRKTEELEGALLARMQQLVNATFMGWGADPRPRTRDRPKDPIASWLEVRSVVYVQNAESYLNYQARRLLVAAEMPPDAATGEAWDVKTARVPLGGVGRHRSNPVNPAINEHYLWHGTSPEGAVGITDTDFQLKRAGTAHGMLFGPGIYLSESCMKADEYTRADGRGWFPLVLCRVILGNVNYCDVADPKKHPRGIEASCRPGGGFHCVLGDREKVRQTFREFVVYDSHQVYPEYIVWYIRR